MCSIPPEVNVLVPAKTGLKVFWGPQRPTNLPCYGRCNGIPKHNRECPHRFTIDRSFLARYGDIAFEHTPKTPADHNRELFQKALVDINPAVTFYAKDTKQYVECRYVQTRAYQGSESVNRRAEEWRINVGRKGQWNLLQDRIIHHPAVGEMISRNAEWEKSLQAAADRDIQAWYDAIDRCIVGVLAELGGCLPSISEQQTELVQKQKRGLFVFGDLQGTRWGHFFRQLNVQQNDAERRLKAPEVTQTQGNQATAKQVRP